MYDLAKDPNESWNCWNNKAYQSIKIKLFKRLFDRMIEAAAPRERSSVVIAGLINKDKIQ
ncbi:hypothetical protein [Gracilibacillus alcaliphilus]|uniref:hypothetical protein n=1 Tax=Gracilibacillus alcaliphilus TaxID=1401441 RepID=UPI001959EC05|nr:hypothetical protein [Gracilibacillus alcaliphilus]MBM7676837.1 hypothetical protein [Gracilibacillus alcaliphilus]